MANILHRPIPLVNTTGRIIPLFETYERERIGMLLDEGKKLQVVVEEADSSSEVSDEVRGFFYGHVFNWVTSVYEKYVQETISVDRKIFGKKMLLAIYERESNAFEFCGLKFKVEEKPLSFSRSDSNKRILRAIDIWTSWFAENLQEEFPQPDKEWKVKK